MEKKNRGVQIAHRLHPLCYFIAKFMLEVLLTFLIVEKTKRENSVLFYFFLSFFPLHFLFSFFITHNSKTIQYMRI